MAEIRLICCDECANTIDDRFTQYDDDSTWLVVLRCGVAQNLEFCSMQCAAAWFAKQVQS